MKKTAKKHINFEKLNVSKKVCNHIIGKEHTQSHRVTAGLVFMVFGVFVAKLPVGHILGHVLFETIGFLFHCVGAIPLVNIAERIAESKLKEGTDENEQIDELEEQG